MPTVIPYIPGSDIPARPSKAAQLAAIRARAKASEAVVNLLASLAFSGADQPDLIAWPVPTWAHAEGVRAHG